MLVFGVFAALTPVIVAPGEVVEAYTIREMQGLLLACFHSHLVRFVKFAIASCVFDRKSSPKPPTL